MMAMAHVGLATIPSGLVQEWQRENHTISRMPRKAKRVRVGAKNKIGANRSRHWLAPKCMRSKETHWKSDVS